MPADINFLPKELQPKRKKEKEETIEIELSRPLEEKFKEKDKGRKTKGGFGRLFGIGKNKKEKESNEISSAAASPFHGVKEKDLAKERNNLLSYINEKEKHQPEEKVIFKYKGEPAEKEKKAAKESFNLPMQPAIKLSLWQKFQKWLKDLEEKMKQAKEEREMKKKLILAKRKERKDKKVKNSLRLREGRGIKLKVKSDASKQDDVEKKAEEKEKTLPIPSSRDQAEKNERDAIENKVSSPAPAKIRKLGLNLMKGNEFAFFNWPKTITVNIVSILISIAIIVFGWSYLSSQESVENSNIASLEKEKMRLEQELLQLENEVNKLDNLREKVSAAGKLIKNHIYWTEFFVFLENITLPNVYYEGFEGDLSGQYSLAAVAGDFDSFLAQLKQAQENEEYVVFAETTSADIGGTGDGGSGGNLQETSFELSLIINPKIFLRTD